MEFFPQLRNELDSVQAIGKTVVGEYEVGPNDASCHEIQCRDAITRCCRAMTLAFQESLKQFANLGIVVDDKDLASVVGRRDGASIHCAAVVSRSQYRSTGRKHDLDGEDRTFARQRADAHPMAEQIAQPLHDGEPEAKAAA